MLSYVSCSCQSTVITFFQDYVMEVNKYLKPKQISIDRRLELFLQYAHSTQLIVN